MKENTLKFVEKIFSPNFYLVGKNMLIPQEKTNRNYKDSVFVDLFAHDVTAKENFISLYNALHGTNLDAKTTDVQPVMLEQVLYMKYYNDIAMLIDGKIVILIEHQSTINQNHNLTVNEHCDVIVILHIEYTFQHNRLYFRCFYLEVRPVQGVVK